MNEEVLREIEYNQGDAAESFVKAILQRRGFTTNTSEKDRWGWDLAAEHIGANSRKIECAVQVKSTRLLKKNDLQIRLSALLRLIKSSSICIISYVKFDPPKDFPTAIYFYHVGEELIEAAIIAEREANRTGVKPNKKWVSVPYMDGILIEPGTSHNIDILTEIINASSVFGDMYAAGKREFVTRIQENKGCEINEKECFLGNSDVAWSTAKGEAKLLSVPTYVLYQGVKVRWELRHNCCNIRITGGECSYEWNIKTQTKLSDLDAILRALTIIENLEWKIKITGSLNFSDQSLRGFKHLSEDQLYVMRYVHSMHVAMSFSAGAEEPMVRFEEIGGFLFSRPDLNDVLSGKGGELKLVHGLKHVGPYTFVHICSECFGGTHFLFQWRFYSWLPDYIQPGGFARIDRGELWSVSAFDSAAELKDFADRLGIDVIDESPLDNIIYLSQAQRTAQPKVSRA